MDKNLIVVPTIPGDVHALAVAEATKGLGLHTWVWHSSNIAINQNIAFHIGEKTYISVLEDDNELVFGLENVIAFWNRRIRDVVVSKNIHPGDIEASQNNLSKFRSSIFSWLTLADHKVNDFYSARRAENKALQLHIALELGLETPETLMANSRNAIAEFIKSASSSVLTKAFQPATWKTSDGYLANYSALVEIADLPSDGGGSSL